MCEAMRDLMKDEIQEENKKAVDASMIVVIKNLMHNKGWGATEAMDSLGIPVSDQLRYATHL